MKVTKNKKRRDPRYFLHEELGEPGIDPEHPDSPSWMRRVDPEGITGKTKKTADPRMRHRPDLGVETQQLKNAEKVYSKAQYLLMQAENLEKAIRILASQSGMDASHAQDAKGAIDEIMVVAPMLQKALSEQALRGGQSGGGEQQTRSRTTEVPDNGYQ